jgi:predicted permease
MSLVERFAGGLRALVGRQRTEREMDEELLAYVEAAVNEKRRDGMSLEDARRAVRMELGSMEAVKEEVRAVGWEAKLETIGQDLRYAFRLLARSPGFAAVAVLSLALGIGANTSIFTLINGVLLKSLPVHDPQQLVSFGIADGGGIIAGLRPGAWDLFPYDLYKQIENQNEVFNGLCAFDSRLESVRVRTAGPASNLPEQAYARLVSGSFFGVLGVDPTVGRMIDPSDAAAPGRNPVVVLSYRYWQRKFAGDSGAIGQSIIVNGTSFTVIGVAPPAFFGERIDANPPDMWMPLTMQPQVALMPSLLDPQGMFWLHLIGRRKAGVTWEQMQAWVNLKFRQYLIEQQGARLSAGDRQTIAQMYVDLTPGGRGVSHLRAVYAEPLEILMGAVLLVLLIACANLANLLLARAAAREKEFSTRLALGAGRARIMRQMLTETLLISCLGGLLGLLFAYWGTRLLIGFVMAGSRDVPIQPGPDGRVLVFTLAVSLLTGLLFGLAPAVRVSQIGLAPGLKAGSRTVSGDDAAAGRFPLPKVLVAAQVALSMALLAGAGLFVRTLRNIKDQDFGFDRQSVLMLRLDSRLAGYAPDQLIGLHQRILETMGSLPGVRSATISTVPPLSGTSWTDRLTVEGHLPQPHEDMGTSINAVGPKYFETVGIPLLMGRPIGSQDSAGTPRVAVINQTIADDFFPHRSPIGRHVSFSDPSGTFSFEIVGVARNSKYHQPRETPRRMIYPALAQLSGDDLYADWLQIRTTADPAMLTEGARRALTGIDSNLPISQVVTLNQQVDGLLDHDELISRLSGFFALLALALACVGLYGVMSYNVARRTNEIGIRMALGAQRPGVMWLVLKEGILLLGIGLVAGVPITLTATRLVRSQLFGLQAYDPATFAVAILAIVSVTLLAGYLPAHRATRVNPIRALRYE